jgi:hypothetical protein
MSLLRPSKPRVLNIAPKQFDIYCDESCTRDRFMVYGGLVLPTRDVQKFNDLMREWRVKHNVAADSELAWESVANHKLSTYKSLIDFYMQKRWRDGFMNLKAMICDRQSQDYVAFIRFNHKISDDLGYYKLYQVFLRHKLGPYARDNDYSLAVYLDERSTNYDLAQLKEFLNLGIRKRQPFVHRDVVETIDTRISHETEALQLADVLMGAIGWAMNDKDKEPNANYAKTQLAIYLATCLRIPSRSLKDAVPSFRDPLFDKWMFRFTGEQPWRLAAQGRT